MTIRNEEISAKVDKLCTLQKQMAKLKKEADELSGFFTVQAKKDLGSSKCKSVKYAGSGANEITATTATSIELVHTGILKRVLGKEQYENLVKKEIKYSLKGAPNQRVLAGMVRDEYISSEPKDVINEFCMESTVAEALINKCRGDIHYEDDKKALMQIGGLSERNAEYFAYFISEAFTNESFKKLIAQGEYAEDVQGAVLELKKAVMAKATEKIKVSYDESDTAQSA